MTANNPAPAELSEITKTEDFRYLLSKNDNDKTAEKYLAAFGQKNSFNLSAFLFFDSWYAYRRMFGRALLYFLLQLIVSTGTAAMYYCTVPQINPALGDICFWSSILTVRVIIGFSSNKEYRGSLTKKCGKAAELPPEKKERYLKKHRGTCAGFLYLWLIYALLIILFYLWMISQINTFPPYPA